MRISILLIALAGLLAFSPANAGKEMARNADMAATAAACDVLAGTTRGLYGLCMAYCAPRDLSQVDLNDTASMRAAGPNIKTLRQYNERRRPADPEMPCFKNTDDGDDGDDDGDDGDDNGDGDDGGTTLPPSNCPCWTAEELAAIDGLLIEAPDFGPNATECTRTAISEQTVEGYRFFAGISPEGLAFATVDDDGAYYACRYRRQPNTDPDENLEVRDMLMPIERVDADACQAEIVTHCTTP